MFEHISYHLNWAKIIKNEIIDDDSDWFYPKGKRPGEPNKISDFELGRMRFINRNLNYFYYENMLSHALKNDYEYNKFYPNALNFCNEMRIPLNEHGPFGRMCIWKIVPNGFLSPHVDNWEYHSQIRRYIFCISEHEGKDVVIKIQNSVIDVKQGLLFQFNPSRELHEFVNKTDTPWYFLGFDYWDLDKLLTSALDKGLTKETEIPYDHNFGGYKSKAKYMSKE